MLCNSGSFATIKSIKPGLHKNREDRKHMVANKFLKLFTYALVFTCSCNDRRYSCFTRNICNRCIDSLKSSLKQRRKHALRMLQLYQDQAIRSFYPAIGDAVMYENQVLTLFPLGSKSLVYHGGGGGGGVDSIDNEAILKKPLASCGKIKKTYMKNECITCHICRITVKFGTSVAHDKPISHAKQNFETSTDVIDNDVIMSKFECFRRKALNFKMLYHSSLWMKLFKIWSGY